MCLPGHFGNEAYAQTRVGIGAAERINDEQTLAGKLMSDQIFQVLPGFLRERFVVVFTVAFIRPPHGIAGCIVTNDIFIFRRTTGKDTGIDGDRAQIGEYAALIPFQSGIEFFLIQRIVTRVVDDILDVIDTISLEILRG